MGKNAGRNRPHGHHTKKNKFAKPNNINHIKCAESKSNDTIKEDNNVNEPENTRMTAKNIDSNNKYHTSDRGPFFVVVEKDGINVIKIAKILNNGCVRDVLDLRPRGKNKVRILFKSAQSANNFIDANIFNKQDPNLKIYIPNMYIQSVGVVSYVPTDISEEELFENMRAECHITKVERITRWDSDAKVAIPTTSIKVWFRQTILPNMVQLYLANVRVRYFIPNPTMCRKCLRYGHTKNFCKDRLETCNNCAKQHDGVCTFPTTCKYCSEGHKTNDKECNEYKKQKSIKRLMVTKRMTYKEAIEIIKNDFSFPNKKVETNNEMNELKRDNDNIKKQLIKCQNTLDKIFQAVAHYENDKSSNDLILLDILDTLRNDMEPNKESDMQMV